ncbi:MAG: DUF3857 and transglutaminase domain-containing protein [Acidobacteriota bacterium]|nr:DUF3857 and transglutaminase domain-containing protein [Acidobacteriota bacterium]
MRARHQILFMIAIATILYSPSGLAQKFQQPTKEELAMTVDPKAPSAPAVYLYREEVTDNYNHYVSAYARIKVLTEAGKEWANVEVPFGGAPPDIAGRTIHPDGTVVPLTGSPADILKVQTGRENLRVRVFSLPSVEVGSILEYRWTIHMGDSKVSGVDSSQQSYIDSALAGEIPEWNLQEPIFIHKEHFYFNPLSDLERNVIGNQSITHYVNGEIANYLLHTDRLPPGVKLNASPKRDYDLTLEDVPAFVSEVDAPPQESLAYHVRFFYSPYLSGAEYWLGEGKRWSKQLDQLAGPSNVVRAAATQITAGATTDEDKAMRLYAAVQALDNTTFSKGETSGHDHATPDQTWTQKSGTSNDMALLYLSLVRAAGLNASDMLIADRSKRIFDPGLLSLDQLSADIVVLHINGKDVFTDPGEKFVPYGQLAWQHQLCGGLEETAQGVTYQAVTPAGESKDAITGRTADLTVDAQGNVTGTANLLMNGPAALRWRQVALMGGEQNVKQQIASTLPGLLPEGIYGEVMELKGLGTSAGFFEATIKVSGKLGNVEGKRVIVPAFFFETRQHPQFVADTQRQFPVDMHYAAQVIDSVVYHSPAGYTVEGQPPATQIPWPQFGAMVIRCQPVAGGIEIKHILARVFTLLAPQEYPNLRDFYGKVAAADQQHVVFSQGAQ